jgi:hypothetical protein
MYVCVVVVGEFENRKREKPDFLNFFNGRILIVRDDGCVCVCLVWYS